MRRALLCAAAGLIAVVPAACGGGVTSTPTAPSETTTTTAPAAQRPAGPSSDWPTYHRDNARTGASSDGPPLGRVRRLWSTSIDGAVSAEPLVLGGRVIVATE